MGFDWTAMQRTAHREFSDRLAAVSDWSLPTPDSEWNVRDLVAHVVRGQQRVPLLLAGRSVGEIRSRLAPLGSDLVAEWAAYSRTALAAWDDADPASLVRLPGEAVTAADFLTEQTAEVAIHAWDLARAVGATETLDSGLVEAAWTLYEPIADTLTATGLFGAPVTVPDDAPLQVRLLAITGRDASRGDG